MEQKFNLSFLGCFFITVVREHYIQNYMSEHLYLYPQEYAQQEVLAGLTG